MKKSLKYTFPFLIPFITEKVMACEACKKQQPGLFQGLTHGSGPDSQWDYLIVTIMIIITLYVFIASVRHILKPSERNQDHIKRIILNDLNL